MGPSLWTNLILECMREINAQIQTYVETGETRRQGEFIYGSSDEVWTIGTHYSWSFSWSQSVPPMDVNLYLIKFLLKFRFHPCYIMNFLWMIKFELFFIEFSQVYSLVNYYVICIGQGCVSPGRSGLELREEGIFHIEHLSLTVLQIPVSLNRWQIWIGPISFSIYV